MRSRALRSVSLCNFTMWPEVGEDWEFVALLGCEYFLCEWRVAGDREKLNSIILEGGKIIAKCTQFAGTCTCECKWIEHNHNALRTLE